MESAREALGHAAQSTRDLADAARHRALTAGERAQGYVRDDPLKSVVVAAAMGAALTTLLMFALRRHH